MNTINSKRARDILWERYKELPDGKLENLLTLLILLINKAVDSHLTPKKEKNARKFWL